MLVDISSLVSAKIQKYCLPIFNDGHFKQAAHEAMIQVESALKDKGHVKDGKFGKKLINSLFDSNTPYVKLKVPLSEDMQEEARELFRGVFGYYRNYTAHDGSNITRPVCIRIMLLASELLDLIDASALSYEQLGGPNGLIKAKIFEDKQSISDLLKLLDDHCLPDGDAEGLRDTMLEMGLDDTHLNAVIDLDLVRYQENDYAPSLEELLHESYSPQTMGIFTITEEGRKFIEVI